MKITCIHPSRGRAQMAFNTAKKWLDSASNPENIEYILSLDMDDNCDAYAIFNSDNLGHEAFLLISENRSAIDAINIAAEQSTGDLLIVVSDDFCCMENWDYHLLSALEGKEDFIVKTQDGIQKTLITLPILDRKYYERFGYVYFGGFRHMWADNDMTAVGHLLGRVIELPILFKHEHYITGAMQMDTINERNNSTWAQGEALFNERLKSNFGLNPEEIVKSYQEIVWR